MKRLCIVARHLFNWWIVSVACVACQATSTPHTSFAEASQKEISIPSQVSTFVNGFAVGDESEMYRAASPIFSLELRRLGLNTPERRALLRPAGLTYVPLWGTRDANGYGHWYYTTRATSNTGVTQLSIWRIDSDKYDFVIWMEPAYFYSGCEDAVKEDLTVSHRDPSHAPPFTSQTVIFSAFCPQTHEGYYVFRSDADDRLGFVIINVYGGTYADAWSFGQSLPMDAGKSDHAIFHTNSLFKGPGNREYWDYLTNSSSTLLAGDRTIAGSCSTDYFHRPC